MSKKYHLNLIKNKRSYSPSEIGRLLKLDVRTCLRWISEEGLSPVQEDARPLLVMGYILKDFLKQRNFKRGCPLNDQEFFCFKCHRAVIAKIGTEAIQETGRKLGKQHQPQLVRQAVCGQCGTLVMRFIRVSRNN